MNANDLRHMDDVENGNDPFEAPKANARYTAKVRGSRIDMTAPELPLDLNQMIVWIMHSPDAMYLLPAYKEIRQRAEERDEGSAKNHGIEV